MSMVPLPPAERERALQLIRTAVASSNKQAVATRLGYSRPALSRLLGGSYGDPDRLLRTALSILDSVLCPHTGHHEQRSVCHAQLIAEPPTHNPYRLAHWHACRRCPHKPAHPENPQC